MNPDYDRGDILIRRVSNGWIAVSANEQVEGETQVFVYEDKENPNWVSESLYHLIVDQFHGYLQSKRSAGIKISFSHKTREEEEEQDD